MTKLIGWQVTKQQTNFIVGPV